MSQPARLPDFLLIGAPKAGTTALFRTLSRHPQIFCSPQKEPRFFAHAGKPPRYTCPGGRDNSSTIVFDEESYLTLFSGCPPLSVAGESSTMYLASQRAPAVAFDYVPHARLIAVLRHPVERAYSHYLHLRQEGHERFDDFADAWAAENARIERGWRPSWQYRKNGFYGRHLARWLEFYPMEQVLILFYEDWVERPARSLDLICEHLGIESARLPITQENVSSRQPRWPWLHHRMVEHNELRSWAQRRLPLAVRDAITGTITALNLQPSRPLDAGLRERLARTYCEDLRYVETMTRRDLNAWRH